jgi:ATP-binding cassette, subfamily B, bacterial
MEKSLEKAFFKILDLLRLDRKDILTIYFYSILAGVLALSLPLGIQAVIGFVMAGSLSTSIIVLVALVLLGTFFNGSLQIKQLQMIEKIEQKLFVRYALEYGNRLPKLNFEKLDSYYLPELVNRFFDISGLQKSLHKLLVDIPAAIIQVVLGTVLLAFYHPLFIAFGIFLFLIVGLILKFTSASGFKTSMEASDNKYKVAAWLEEIARSIKSFKYAKESNFHILKTDELVNNYLTAKTNHFNVLKFQYWSLIAFKILIVASMMLIGVTLLVNQQINIGQFIAADIVIISIMGSVEKLIINLEQIYEALTSVEKLNKVATAEIETSGNQNLDEKQQGLSIEFENVDFKYESQNETLTNISFKVNPSQWVQLIGKSGSGKSTILRLLTGAFRSFSGKILIDNLPLRNYKNQSLRNNTGVFLSQQDIFLGTLKQNLTMGLEGYETSEILFLANLTGLFKFIQSNENGLDSIIDPVGKRLTAEIRHDILLTRAILGKNRLLLLEDPFKYMSDTESENLVKYLKKTHATVFITSDGKEYGNYCDQIIKLENGKLNGIIFK